MNAAELIEEIAQRIEATGRDPLLNLAWMYPNEAAALVRSFADELAAALPTPDTDDELRDAHPTVKGAELCDGFSCGAGPGRRAER